MADQPTVNFSIAYWKPSGDRHITPTSELAEATIIRIQVGAALELEFLRERDPHMFDHRQYHLDRLRGALQSAFDQGRGAQARLMRDALNPFG